MQLFGKEIETLASIRHPNGKQSLISSALGMLSVLRCMLFMRKGGRDRIHAMRISVALHGPPLWHAAAHLHENCSVSEQNSSGICELNTAPIPPCSST